MIDSLRMHWRRIGLLMVLMGITVAALILWGGGRSTLATIAAANRPLLLLALVIHYSGFAVRGHRWQRLLALTGHRLAYGWVTGLLFSGWFISALLPARAGDVARIGLLRTPPPPSANGQSHPPVPVADSLGSIVLERALDIFAILVLGATFGFVALRERLPGWLLWSYAGAVLVLAVLAIALLIAPALFTALRRIPVPARVSGLWHKGWTLPESWWRACARWRGGRARRCWLRARACTSGCATRCCCGWSCAAWGSRCPLMRCHLGGRPLWPSLWMRWPRCP